MAALSPSLGVLIHIGEVEFDLSIVDALLTLQTAASVTGCSVGSELSWAGAGCLLSNRRRNLESSSNKAWHYVGKEAGIDGFAGFYGLSGPSPRGQKLSVACR